MLKIVEASENDFEIIHQLAHKIWPPTFGNILSEDQLKYMLELMYSVASIKEQADKKGHKFILVKEDEAYFGYASYELNYKNLSKTKIHKIYILPETQGKGIGRLMMNYISEKALTVNNHSLILNVNRNNPAIKFYEKIGFVITGEEDIDIGNNYFMNDYVMEKSLSPTLSQMEGI